MIKYIEFVNNSNYKSIKDMKLKNSSQNQSWSNDFRQALLKV